MSNFAKLHSLMTTSADKLVHLLICYPRDLVSSLHRSSLELLVGPSLLNNNRRVQLITLAAYHKVPSGHRVGGRFSFICAPPASRGHADEGVADRAPVRSLTHYPICTKPRSAGV
jgi:hypothetical protein